MVRGRRLQRQPLKGTLQGSSQLPEAGCSQAKTVRFQFIFSSNVVLDTIHEMIRFNF